MEIIWIMNSIRMMTKVVIEVKTVKCIKFFSEQRRVTGRSVDDNFMLWG